MTLTFVIAVYYQGNTALGGAGSNHVYVSLTKLAHLKLLRTNLECKQIH